MSHLNVKNSKEPPASGNKKAAVLAPIANNPAAVRQGSSRYKIEIPSSDKLLQQPFHALIHAYNRQIFCLQGHVEDHGWAKFHTFQKTFSTTNHRFKSLMKFTQSIWLLRHATLMERGRCLPLMVNTLGESSLLTVSCVGPKAEKKQKMETFVNNAKAEKGN